MGKKKPESEEVKEEKTISETENQPVDQAADKDSEVQEEDPIDVLNKEIEDLQKQLADSKTSLLRAYADTDNTRKRLQRETEMARKYRFQSAALEILPILDNLELALSRDRKSVV